MPEAPARNQCRLGVRQEKATIMVEDDVRKAWGMVRQAAERLAEEAAKLETEATGDDVRDVPLLAVQPAVVDRQPGPPGDVQRRPLVALRERRPPRPVDQRD